jgi:hypothetical protein
MDKGLNNYTRRALGFFFTSGKESAANKIEHDVFAHTVKWVGDALRERKIRSATILKKLSDLGSLTEDAAQEVIRYAKEHKYAPLDGETPDSTDSAYGYSSAIIFAVIGWRNEKMERLRDREHDDEHAITEIQEVGEHDESKHESKYKRGSAKSDDKAAAAGGGAGK